MPGIVIYYRYGKTIEQKAAFPSCFFGRHKNPPEEGKEGDTMYVTYQDLIQIGILIAALANYYQGKKKIAAATANSNG